MNGLKSKYDDNEVNEKYKEIVQQAENKKLKNQQDIDQIYQELLTTEEYIHYSNLSNLLKPYIEEWQKLDQQVGKDNINKGTTFEQRCLLEGVDEVLNRIKLSRKEVNVLKNLEWNDRKGEVDIVLCKNDKVIALIECKSRLFDVSEGWRQCSKEGRKENGKRFLINGNEKLIVEENVICFIMTTIPEHEYHLGFESELKLDLNKYTLSSDDVGQIDFDEIYNKLVSKYKKYEAPLNWIEKWGQQYLIVLS